MLSNVNIIQSMYSFCTFEFLIFLLLLPTVTYMEDLSIYHRKGVQWTHVKCQIQPWMEPFFLSAFMNRDGMLGHQFKGSLTR
jgi:hypothetical protein